MGLMSNKLAQALTSRFQKNRVQLLRFNQRRCWVLLAFSVWCAPLLADRMVIAGKPFELKLDDGYHVLPPSYTDIREPYLFITLLKTDRVCFLQKKPAFESLDMVRLVIKENGGKIFWYCYEYSPQYFEIDY